jgi:cytochrome c oxidase assembly protein subunit 15
MHLSMALTIYAALVWSGLSLLYPVPAAIDRPGLRRHTLVALVLVCTTMVWGAFVAGLHAGLVYNSFPLMGGHIAPPDLLFLHPLWINFFENPSTVQFTHRVLAITSFCAVLALAFRARRTLPRLSMCLALAITCQVGLGISTLLLMVPVALGAAHQAGAITVLTLLLVVLFALRTNTAPSLKLVSSTPPQDNTAHSG